VGSYRLLIKPSASKEIEALPKQDLRRIVAKIYGLAEDPRPPGCERLSGLEQYRVRQGYYRILYTIEDEKVTVVVVRVAHRKEVYR
jgi:mRNA interferase RelE/StbE